MLSFSGPLASLFARKCFEKAFWIFSDLEALHAKSSANPIWRAHAVSVLGSSHHLEETGIPWAILLARESFVANTRLIRGNGNILVSIGTDEA